jgi:hypothetical protein
LPSGAAAGRRPWARLPWSRGKSIRMLMQERFDVGPMIVSEVAIDVDDAVGEP